MDVAIPDRETREFRIVGNEDVNDSLDDFESYRGVLDVMILFSIQTANLGSLP